MPKIADIQGREILDSRGNPTVKAIITLDNGVIADAAVPSGASTGSFEAFELRDNDPARYMGKGVLKAVENIESKIKNALKGIEINSQEEVDKIMIDADSSDNKKNLGANSILAVSLAYARASAYSLKMPLYEYLRRISGNNANFKTITPLFNVINGGLHGSGSFNFQEFFFIPQASLFKDALQTGVEAYQGLKKFLKSQNLNYSVGDEGGFTPELTTNEEVLDLMLQSIKETGNIYSKDIVIGLDLASSTFYKNGSYLPVKNGKTQSREEFTEYLVKLFGKYKLFFLEDALFEDDWEGWKILTEKIGKHIMIVGDDLLVTNIKRLNKAISEKACNAILVKLNQIGTLSQTLEVINRAKQANFQVIISHRSGETNDDFIADLAVGVGAQYVKFGAPARGERVVKYNRLLEIYREINSASNF